MLRRRKSEVLQQLPERTDQNLLVPMTELQMTYHQENADVVAQIVHRWRKMKFLSDKDQRRLTCALQNMRMSCNSTYLLDQETDHGVKADELAALFEGLLEQSDAKAVVFSQWTRTHDIVIRRLEARGIGYVSFHGGVPSEKRPALLEQRIARIHRMGQKRPVRIINFVAKGTIEEGMLSVLAFKRSLSAGILDGGTGEISLGGSRLNRFMKDVENVTGHMGEGEVMTPAEEAVGTAAPAEIPPVREEEAEATADAGETVREAAQPIDADPWRALAQVGAQLVSALAVANDPAAPAHPWIVRDPDTGAQSLKLPLPPPETAGKIADVLSMLANTLRGQRP